MNLNEQLAFYKESYNEDFKERNIIVSNLKSTLGLMLLLTGLLVFTFKSVDWNQTFPSYHYGAKTAFLAVLFLLVLYPLFSFLFCLHGHKYEKIQSPKYINNYFQMLKKHYEKYNQSEKYVNDAFKQFLINRYAILSERNSKVNDQRSKYAFHCTRGLVFLFLLIIIFLISTVDLNLLFKLKNG
jgi:hypothetical protein